MKIIMDNLYSQWLNTNASTNEKRVEKLKKIIWRKGQSIFALKVNNKIT